MADLISFDVDGTLECGGGPIKTSHIMGLLHDGSIIGITGNYIKVQDEFPADYRRFKWAWGLVYQGLHKSLENKANEKAQVLRVAEFAFGDGSGLRIHVGDSKNDELAALKAYWSFMTPREYMEWAENGPKNIEVINP